MKITEVNERTPELVESLLKLWEGSVRATHLFLTEAEILRIREYVPQALEGIPHLLVAWGGGDHPLGFIGIAEGSLEMLFVAGEARGQGVGRVLLELGMAQYGVDRLAVNEQNPQARGFYERMGFAVYRRTEQDEQGGPYPLLYMKR